MSEEREFYLNNIVVGNFVAFTVNETMFSGKVFSVDGEEIIVKTKNGSVYNITKKDIAWVKNGTHWPVGIYNALKLANSSKGK